ncbi:PREDICTED: ninein-like protein [Priapulus caudatus]|uniref:Ninein-like protein n=1 Tax=Priapulus caudatus TaxID=37621 RepID=A0ABM1E5L4_PRICU|nr:PREDICTED: ninein-like protein [Priapulus caudatus]
MSSETDDDDVYVARLREVFNDCCDDGQQQQQCGDARLGRDGLLLLCERLQLQEQAGNLLERCTAGRTDGKVDFENFKEAFVLVLSQTVDSTGTSTGVSTPAEGGPDGTTDDESSIEDEIVPVEVSPKFVKGCKKYGRRSRPEGPMHTESQSEDEQHNVEEKRHWLDTRSSAGSLIGLSPRGFPTPIASPQPLLRTVTPSSEMFEASGQLNGLPLNQHTATALPGSQATAEVSADITQQLEAVWNEVDAQQKGYLSREELGCMCQHVGMESLSEEVRP